MKKILVILCFLLASCGQDPAVDLSGTTILWQGNVRNDAGLSQRYDGVVACLSNLSLSTGTQYVRNTVPPYVVMTSGHFLCNGEDTVACTSNGVIYIMQFYVTNVAYVFEHEDIHVITLLGDESHGTLPFTTCAM